MNKIKYGTEFLDQLKDSLHDLYEENKELKEENEVLNGILETQRKRKYYSKFLKYFQKENGINVFPDFDEIYKRYDDYKERIDKAIEWCEDCYVEIINDIGEKRKFISCERIVEILRGEDDE